MVSSRLADRFKWWRSEPQIVGKTAWADIRWAADPPDAEVFASGAALKLKQEECVVLGVDARGREAAAASADDIYAVARSRNIHPVILTSGNPLDWAVYGFDVEYVPDGDAGSAHLDQVLKLWAAAGVVPLASLVKAAGLLPTGEAPMRRHA